LLLLLIIIIIIINIIIIVIIKTEKFFYWYMVLHFSFLLNALRSSSSFLGNKCRLGWWVFWNAPTEPLWAINKNMPLNSTLLDKKYGHNSQSKARAGQRFVYGKTKVRLMKWPYMSSSKENRWKKNICKAETYEA
jgi:hypothetical protein